jgi:proteic killer suppression protein
MERYKHGLAIMIRSFKDKLTEAVFQGRCPKGFPADLFRVARRKLEAVNAAGVLDDLRAPPGNRLEALSSDRAGQHSIRINDQWRICFVWSDGGADHVEIVDYH